MSLADATYNTITGFGPLGQNPGGGVAGGAESLSRFEGVISTTIGVVTVIGGIWFTMQIFIGAYQWITAGSDKDAVQKAQKRFTNSFVGLVVLVFSYTLIALVGNIIGLNIFSFATSIMQSVQ